MDLLERYRRTRFFCGHVMWFYITKMCYGEVKMQLALYTWNRALAELERRASIFEA